MLRPTTLVTLAILFNLFGCSPGQLGRPDSLTPLDEDCDGCGGGMPYLTMPFPSGTYWAMTRGYNQDTHQDWGFEYGDDSYALDFSRGGCEAYDEPVTPIAPGTVYMISTDGNNDHGYGNSIIIDHGDDYKSRYAHLSQILVENGDYVDTHDYIGRVGNTGNCEGTACPEHPGTHLHLVMYWEEECSPDFPESVPMEPLSDIWDFSVGCWYNREGDENCDEDPGDYDPEDEGYGEPDGDDDDDADDDDHDYEGGGDLDIAYFDISPNEGTADETEFVWVAIVESPDGEPWVSLNIYNPDDNHTYFFDMEPQNDKSPWVFTYRKKLQSPILYNYWMETELGNSYENSGIRDVSVDESYGNEPAVVDFSWSPSNGNAGSTEFTWDLMFWSDHDADATLHIANPNDAWVYDFDMNANEWYNSSWEAEYEKSLQDEDTTYVFWATMESSVSAASTIVGSVDVN
jgi:hypothetical protein